MSRWTNFRRNLRRMFCDDTSKTPLALFDDMSRPRGHVAFDVSGKYFLANNAKVLAAEMARQRIKEIDAIPLPQQPVMIDLKGRVAKQADIESDWARYWFRELQLKLLYSRKYWEWAFITQGLYEAGLLRADAAGLGLGCGTEPLPCYFVSKGCRITAGDQPPTGESAKHWTEYKQFSQSVDSLYKPGIMECDEFARRLTFRHVDMNELPDDLFGKFDFCWSSCVIEHLGSIEKGLRFLKASLSLLKPGGVSIHTTEFNYLDTPKTFDNCDAVVFKKQHLENLAKEVQEIGGKVEEFNYSAGNGPFDQYIDTGLLPWEHVPGLEIKASSFYPTFVPHIKFWWVGLPTTSIGVIIRKL